MLTVRPTAGHLIPAAAIVNSVAKVPELALSACLGTAALGSEKPLDLTVAVHIDRFGGGDLG